mgnify:CR=1 FL=1
MPYVMVPVPEEHEQEFMSELMQFSLRESLNAWDRDVLGPFVDGLVDHDRTLVSALAQATERGQRLTRTQVCTLLGLDLPQVSVLVDDLNRRSNDLSQPYLVLTGPAVSADGGEADQVLLVTKSAAAIVLARLEEPDR